MMKARLVSSVAFGAPAALLVLIAVGAVRLVNPTAAGALDLLVIALLFAGGAAALVGFLVGPRLARAATSMEAIVIGVLATVAAALVFWAGVAVFMAVGAASRGSFVWKAEADFFLGAVVGWVLYSLATALAVSPLGAAAGLLGWRWIHRGALDPAA